MDNNMNPFNGGNGNGSGNGSQGPNGSGGSGQNNPRRTSLILLAIAAIVTLISMSLFMRMINNATNQEITYGKFQELVEDGKAAEVTWVTIRFISNCSRQTRRHCFLRCRR